MTLAILATVLGFLFERTLAELRLAQARNERLEAQLGFADTQADIIYRLLTNPMTFAGVGIAPNEIRVDDTVYRGDRATLVSLQDTRGLFNLNTMPDERLSRLLQAMKVEPLDAARLIDTLRDYTDDDDLRRLNGAEAPDYAAAGLPAPRNAALMTPLDLRNVLGWPNRADLWGERSIEALTTTARVMGFNPNTAPLEVLMTVPGVTRESAQALVALRKERTVFEPEFIQFGGAEPSTMFLPTLVMPAATLRVTHYAPKASWAMRYSVTLTPRDPQGPWRIDYAYRVARPEPALGLDEKKIPDLPRRTSTPSEEMPDLLAPFVGR
jgi:general secretion pathway protein K